MNLSTIADNLWGPKARFRYLLVAAILLLFVLLGARDIWTQEHRWADIVSGMFYRHDFLHPYLGENRYYDKPLLSYWFIAIVAKLMGELTTLALRLPSALAGLLAVWSIYRLGTVLKDSLLGLLAGWMLLTTFYFVFWARTSSADMLNLAGSVFAVTWYFEKRDKARFFDYTIFFLIIALTSLCKGLVGAIVPVIAVMVDILLQKSWRRYLQWSMCFALIPALIVYILPFWASSHFGGDSYGQNGLYLVYRENILRYFQPFDHQGPIYTYLLYLPIYLLPWSVFFILALGSLKGSWKILPSYTQWMRWTLLLLFLFFTLSGSRRSYYVLPMVPFAILLTADWILSEKNVLARRYQRATVVTVLSFLLLLLAWDILPAWYYSRVGVGRFAAELKEAAVKVKPWETWDVVMLDAESKLNFYLRLPPTTRNWQIKGSTRDEQTTASFESSWPILRNKPSNTIFITRKRYMDLLRPYFVGYRVVVLPPDACAPFSKKHDLNESIAFIPIP